jgi:hypothetical protein
MANWCINRFVVSHDNLRVISRIRKAFSCGRLFDEFIRAPTERTMEKDDINLMSWTCKNWGTPCDVGKDRFNTVAELSPNAALYEIETRDTPPLIVFNHWVGIGCHVNGWFWEPFMQLKGTYSNKKVRYEKCEPPETLFRATSQTEKKSPIASEKERR